MLGGELVVAITVLNQSIASFNAQVARIDALKAANIEALAGAYAMFRDAIAKARESGDTVTWEHAIATLKGKAGWNIAAAVIAANEMLHVRAIGCADTSCEEGRYGVFAFHEAARAAFSRDRL